MNPFKFVSGFLVASAVLLVGAAALEAQELGRITGEVRTSPAARPLEGAQVSLEGTAMGSLTNEQGRYLILNVPPGDYAVRVTMLGYGTERQEVTVRPGSSVVADFNLNVTALALDEIVVTGTAAEVRAKEIGNAVDAISGREIQTMAIRNTEEVLAGRIPGVTMLTNSGQPGAGGTVKVRGITTVSQTMDPLIYVDGVRIHNLPTATGWDSRTSYHPLQNINAGDIERIEVVKGASATTLYGTEASGGVIQIFTKRGISGRPIWNADVSLGLNNQSSFLNNADEDPTDLYTKCGRLDDLYSLNIQANKSDPDFGDRIYIFDPTCPADGDWQDSGLIHKYNLSVRGGAGDVTYYLSGNYNDQEGVLPTGRSRDGGFRANIGFEPMDELTFSLNSAYTRRNSRWVHDGNNADGFLLNVGRGAQNYLQGGREGDCDNIPLAPDGSQRECVTNGYLFESELTSQMDHFISGLTVQWNPLEGFSNRLAVGWDYTDMNAVTVLPFNYLRNPEGVFWDELTRHTKLSLDYTGSFQNMFGDDFQSTFSWGAQLFRDWHRWTEIDVEGFAGPGDPTLESGAELTFRAEYTINQASAGFFFQEMLGWQDRLFLTGGLRVDGNSAFGDDYGLQYYPKVSLAWVVSDHDFFPTDIVETLKLRSALGWSGKAPGPFDKVRTWQAIGIEGEPGFTPGDVGNELIGPEQTREFEFGFDLSALDGRLGAEVTYYDAETTDALVGRTLPPSKGFLASRTENIGTLENTGWEMQFTGTPFRSELIDWRVRANLSFMESRAVDLDGDGCPPIDPATGECPAGAQITSLFADNKAEFREGHFVPVYVGERVMNPNDIADPIIVNDTILGPAYPTRLIGLGTTIRIGERLAIDALAEHQGGHLLPNYTGYQNARRGSWHPCFGIQQKLIDASNGDASALNNVTAMERARCAVRNTNYIMSNGERLSHNSDFWVEEADFWKLRSVMVTYDLPENILPLARSASVSLSARNLFTWTDYSGTDPEVMDFRDFAESVYDGASDYGRRDYYQIPNPRTYTLGFRVSW